MAVLIAHVDNFSRCCSIVMKFKIRMSGHSLKSENRGRSGDREEAIRKARERQQQLLNERSKIGEEEMKKKQAQEKERRNQIAKDKAKKEQGSGRRLGGTSSGGYNPLQPSTGMSGGYRYAT